MVTVTDRALLEAAAPAQSVREMAARVETLLADFDGVSSPRQAREGAEALVRTIVSLYGSGLERVLEIVYDAAGDRADAMFAKLAEDPFVESLLCLHGLHPVSVEDRVRAALDAVRPYLESHEGGVEIAAIEDDVVLLRLEGSCDGCPSSAATVKLSVEKAILERVPEIREVRAIGLPAATSVATAAPSLRIESDWIALVDIAGLTGPAPHGLAAHSVNGTPVLFVRFDDAVYAYRDRCPACARSLADARVARPAVICRGCGGGFDVVRGGRGTVDEAIAAEPFPLARENGRVRVAIPVVL